jgi:glycosyltransferase involved in cell wall biosynthesis
LKISIIIPHYNDTDNLNELIKSIISSDGFNSIDFEIIIVDDFSNINSREFKFGDYVFYLELDRNQGPAFARNFGAFQSKHEWLLFLDSDTRIFKNSLMLIKKFMSKHQNIKIINGFCHYQPINKNLGSTYKGITEYCWHLDVIDKNIQPAIFNSRVGIIKKDLFLSIGGFDEKIKGTLLEEHEFSYRIPKNIQISLHPELMVFHDFPNILNTTKIYFKRTIKWVELFTKNRKFDNGNSVSGTSANNAVGHLFGALFMLLMPMIYINRSFFLPIELILISAFILVYWKLFLFSYRISFTHLIIVFLLHLYFSLIISFSAFIGFLMLFTKKFSAPAKIIL